MPLDPNATYAATPRGLTRQLFDLIEAVLERLGESTDPHEALKRVEAREFDDIASWMMLEHSAEYVRTTYGETLARWWREEHGEGRLVWPVYQMLHDLVPEVALGARHPTIRFSGTEDWAALEPDGNVLLATREITRAQFELIREEDGERFIGATFNALLHDGRRWVCVGGGLRVELAPEEVLEEALVELLPSSFGDLRSLLQQPPSRFLWSRLCATIPQMEHEPDFEDQILPYVLEHLESWPGLLTSGALEQSRALVPAMGGVAIDDISDLDGLHPRGVILGDDASLFAVLTHPVAPTLQALRIFLETPFTQEMAEALTSAELPALEALMLSFSSCTPGVYETLCRASWLGRLRELYLQGASAPGWAPLFRGDTLEEVMWPSHEDGVHEALASLSRLRWLSTRCSAQVIADAILASLAPLPLERLLLRGPLSQETWRALASTPNLPALTLLHTSETGATPDDVRTILTSPSLPRLEYVSIT